MGDDEEDYEDARPAEAIRISLQRDAQALATEKKNAVDLSPDTESEDMRDDDAAAVAEGASTKEALNDVESTESGISDDEAVAEGTTPMEEPPDFSSDVQQSGRLKSDYGNATSSSSTLPQPRSNNIAKIQKCKPMVQATKKHTVTLKPSKRSSGSADVPHSANVDRARRSDRVDRSQRRCARSDRSDGEVLPLTVSSYTKKVERVGLGLEPRLAHNLRTGTSIPNPCRFFTPSRPKPLVKYDSRSTLVADDSGPRCVNETLSGNFMFANWSIGKHCRVEEFATKLGLVGFTFMCIVPSSAA